MFLIEPIENIETVNNGKERTNEKQLEFKMLFDRITYLNLIFTFFKYFLPSHSKAKLF